MFVVHKPADALKFPDDFVNKIVCGDCHKLIKKIPSGTVDVVLTDPPYGLGKKGVTNDVDLDAFYKILPECYRVLKNDAWFITFFSTKYLPQVFDNNPFSYFWQIGLYSPMGEVLSPIGITKFMSCIIFKKGKPKLPRKGLDLYVFPGNGRLLEPDEGYIDHPTLKPKYFVREILKMFTTENDLVLDPFIGSGTTGVVCKQLNRRFIGFEIEPKYCEIAEKRLSRKIIRVDEL